MNDNEGGSYTEDERKTTCNETTENDLNEGQVLIDEDVKKERSEEDKGITSNNYTAHGKEINKSFIVLWKKKNEKCTPSRKQLKAYVTIANAKIFGRGRPR